MSTLKVNEVFGPTMQGEGPSQGRHVMFLRLSYCNLKCQWCDTKYTWDWTQFDKAKEVHDMNELSILAKLMKWDIKSLVISGGEPLLQQRQLIPLLTALRKMHYWVEVETNGTIAPSDEFLSLVDQVNCSPKLSNSGDTKEKRVKPEALKKLAASEKVYFKFVIGCEKDVEEVFEYLRDFDISHEKIFLMPLGKTQNELLFTTALVKDLTLRHGFRFSSRLHVELWGQKRAV